MKKFGMVVASVLMVSTVLAGCGDVGTAEKVEGKSSAATNATTKASDAPKETPKPTFKTGDVVKMGEYQLVVTKVTHYAGSEFEKPKKGNEYVIVEVKLENKGGDTVDYNPFDFKLANSKGQIKDADFITKNDDTRLESGQLSGNGTVDGTIAFEAPKGDKGLQLQYKPSFWSEDTIKVNLQ